MTYFSRFKSGFARLAVIAVCGSYASAFAATLQAPYQHVAQHFSAESSQIRTSVLGQTEAVVQAGRSILPATIDTLIWGFASGECGQEVWGSSSAERFAAQNVADFNQAGLRYILSTGGQAAMFSCASDEGMRQFVQRYQSPMLAGIDFDIEGQQTDQQIEDLVLRARFLQENFPALRISFTLATHAGTSSRKANLNRTGDLVVRLLQKHRVDKAIINLMVMDYGSANSRVCVLKAKAKGQAARCDMGRSVHQAVSNVASRYKLAYTRIAVTAMIGVNDVLENVFDLDAAQRMLTDARRYAYAGVHFWSLDRDRSCSAPEPQQASPLCHGLPGLAPLSFSKTLLATPQ